MSRPYNGGNCKSCSSKAHVLARSTRGTISAGAASILTRLIETEP